MWKRKQEKNRCGSSLYNPMTRETKAERLPCKANLGYRVRYCLKKETGIVSLSLFCVVSWRPVHLPAPWPTHNSAQQAELASALLEDQLWLLLLSAL